MPRINQHGYSIGQTVSYSPPEGGPSYNVTITSFRSSYVWFRNAANLLSATRFDRISPLGHTVPLSSQNVTVIDPHIYTVGDRVQITNGRGQATIRAIDPISEERSYIRYHLMLDSGMTGSHSCHDGTCWYAQGSSITNLFNPVITPAAVATENLLGWEFEAIFSNPGNPLPENNLRLTHDGSVGQEGKEFILETPKNLKESIEYLVKFLTRYQPKTDTTCGFHVHISKPGLTKKQSLTLMNNLLHLGIFFESDLFQCVPHNRTENRFCKKILSSLTYSPGVKQTAIQLMGRLRRDKFSNDKRYCWLNFVEMLRPGGIKTIEFRLMGNSSRPLYLIAWMLLCNAIFNEALGLDHNNPLEIPRIYARIKSVIDVVRIAQDNVIETYKPKVLELIASEISKEFSDSQSSLTR